MSLLAERKQKQRISVDPQNLHWKNDKKNIGRKLMNNMGWSGGRLGKKGGETKTLRMKINISRWGLRSEKESCEESWSWSVQNQEFAEILAKLNSEKSGEKRKEKNSETIAHQTKRRAKRVFGSTPSMYSNEEKRAIFGRGSNGSDLPGAKPTSCEDRKGTEQEQSKAECESTPAEGNLISSSVNMHDYFRNKMKMLPSKNK